MENTKLIVFSLIVSLVFPVFGYAFTTFESEPTNYDISLNPDALILAGISLSDAESHNLTYEGDWQYFDIENMTIRCKWKSDWREPGVEWIIIGDGIGFEKQSPLGRFMDNWWFPYRLWVGGFKETVHDKALRNISIVQNWDTEFNWTHIRIEGGQQGFIQPVTPSYNITYSVYELGQLTMTIGEVIEESGAFNFRHFASWYMGLLIGDERWGLPSFMSWVIRILSAVMLLSSVIIAKEMISLA